MELSMSSQGYPLWVAYLNGPAVVTELVVAWTNGMGELFSPLTTSRKTLPRHAVAGYGLTPNDARAQLDAIRGKES